MYGAGSQPGSLPNSPAMPVPISDDAEPSQHAGIESALEQIEGERPGAMKNTKIQIGQ